jgi:hypothetical protein
MMKKAALDQLTESIKKCCINSGSYTGAKKTIIKTGGERFPWAIVHQCDLFGQSSEYYEDLDEAVYDYLALNFNL